jgi:Xaa-Pro aminopeptidase
MEGTALDWAREGERRIAEARRRMEAAGLDALLLVSSTNAAYLSGYPSPERTLGRALYVLLPLRGRPAVLAQAWRLEEARRYCWLPDVRGYHRLSAVPFEELDRLWEENRLGAATVGVETGSEQRLGLPLEDFEALCAHFGGTRFVDCGGLLWKLRLVKSGVEVARIRAACRITAEAYAATFATATVGQPGRKIVDRMKTEMIRRGGADPWVLSSFGPGSYNLPTEVPPQAPVGHGDMLWIDAGCTVGGYWSDFSRGAVVGPPSPEQLEAHAAVRAVTAAAVSLIRPGRPVAEIAAACREGLAGLDLEVTAHLSDLAGRVGHGLGLEVTELPHVAEFDSTLLEAGMVITVEPAVATGYGAFHVEENVLVTEDGFEILSTAPWELATVPG